MLEQAACEALTLDRLTKRYGEVTVVDNVSLSVAQGEALVLLGPNGAGKTTLLKMIAGLVRPTSGAVSLFGEQTSTRSIAQKRFIGFVSQTNTLERELTVEETLRVYGRLFKTSDLAGKLEELTARFSLGEIWRQPVSRLSGGTAQRVRIARTLLSNPRLLLLDEPTVGLDPDKRFEIWQYVRQIMNSGVTVVLTTHYMEEADGLGSKVAMLKNGCLLFTESLPALRSRYGEESGATILGKVFMAYSGRREA